MAVYTSYSKVLDAEGKPVAYGSLSEVHGRNVATLQVRDGCGKLALERGDELAPRGRLGAGGPRPTYENYAGGKRIGADANRTRQPLRSHRPGAAEGKTRADDSFKERVPASTRSADSVITLRLLERVIDGDRKHWVALIGEPAHRSRHSLEEERLGFLLGAVAVRRRNQLLRLRHGERREEVGKRGP